MYIKGIKMCLSTFTFYQIDIKTTRPFVYDNTKL